MILILQFLIEFLLFLRLIQAFIHYKLIFILYLLILAFIPLLINNIIPITLLFVLIYSSLLSILFLMNGLLLMSSYSSYYSNIFLFYLIQINIDTAAASFIFKF